MHEEFNWVNYSILVATLYVHTHIHTETYTRRCNGTQSQPLLPLLLPLAMPVPLAAAPLNRCIRTVVITNGCTPLIISLLMLVQYAHQNRPLLVNGINVERTGIESCALCKTHWPIYRTALDHTHYHCSLLIYHSRVSVWRVFDELLLWDIRFRLSFAGSSIMHSFFGERLVPLDLLRLDSLIFVFLFVIWS